MLRRVMSALGVLALCAGAASAQVGTTTDLVVGQIVGPDTLPLRGAHVAVTSLESGITRTVTSDDKGHYSVVFPDGGGRYVVTVQYLGMFPMRTLVARQADEDRLVANVRMAAAAVVLSAIRVRAEQGDTLAGGAGAAGATVSREQLDRLGFLNDDATALAMITPGVSLVQGSDTSLSSLSVGGMAPAQTGHTVDGVAGGGGSLPREAVKSTSVITSAYDVTAGRFTGGLVDQQTISGTNILRANVNSSTPLAPIGSQADNGVLLQRMTGFDLGGFVSGPLRKDHLFYAGAFHSSRTTMPNLSALTLDPATLGRLGVAPDSLARFLAILAQHDAIVGGDVAPVSQFGNHGGFARLDFTPDEHNTLTFSVTQTAYGSRGPFGGYLATPGAGGEWKVEGARAYTALTSHWGHWVNDARVSAARDLFSNDATLPTASGYVVVPSTRTSTGDTPSISTFSFGGYAGTNQQRATSFEAKDEISRMSEDGAHRVKFGLDALATRATGGLPSNTRGMYTFNSLADLEAGRAMAYRRATPGADRRSGVVDLAAYLGDAWRVGPQLQLVYGTRIEQSRFTNPPAFNPDVAAAFGIRTDRFPHETAITPRLGFSFLPRAGGKGGPLFTMRGGIGMFRSAGDALSQVLSSARDATGLPGGVVQLACVGADVPAVDWSAFTDPGADAPTTCANGGMGTGTPMALPSVTLVDPTLRVPTALRASLTVSRSLRKIWNVSLDASLTNESNNTGVRDVNLVAAPSFTIANEGGRPVYVSPGAIVPATGAVALADSRADKRWGVVGLASSSLASRDRSLSLSVGRMGRKLSLNAAYTREWSRMQVLPTLPGLSLFGLWTAVGGDPRIPQWVQSPWAAPHTLRVSMSVTPKPWVQITPSVYARSGFRITPIVSGDVNGDGAANDLAFVFDPERTADTAVANGMQRLLATASPRVRDCLTQQLGHIAAPSSCSGPWSLNGGLNVRLMPPWQGKRLTLSIQVSNVLNGADLLIHGPSHLHGWGQFPNFDQRLLYVRGFDPATNQYRYAVNERFGVARQNQNPIVRPFQLTLAAQLDLGPTSKGPPGMGMLPPMPKGASAGASSSADTLRARIARTLPNRYRRTLALNDSLALHLDTAETARLRSLGNAFQPRADSVVDRIVAAMRAPLTTTAASDVAARVRTETQAGHALEVQAVADLRSILTPDQLAKLPAELTRAP